MISPASASVSSVCSVGTPSETTPTPTPFPPNYARPVFTAAEAAEVFHNRPARACELKRIPGAGRRDSELWPRAYARLRGTRTIFELTRGTLARNRAFRNLGPRWDLEHAERGGPFHGALSHPEFARAFRD